LALSLGATAGCAKNQKSAADAHNAGGKFGPIPGRPDTKTWFKPAQGARSEVVAVQAGVAGDRVSSLIEVPEKSCALIIARATSTIEDLDLLIYGEDGTTLGTDEGADRTPALLICPPHPNRMFVSARIAAGHGLVAIGMERVEPKDAERVARLYHAKNHAGGAEARLSAWPGLDERIAEHRRLIGGSWQDIRRVAVPLDTRIASRLSADVEAARCLDVLVIPSDDVSHLDVAVLDAEGRIVGRAAASGRDRSIIVCSPTPAQITVDMRPHAGSGIGVVMMSRSRDGSERDIDARMLKFDVYPTGDLADTRSKHETRLQALGYPKPKQLATGSLVVGRRTRTELELPKGCVRLDVLTGLPVRSIDAEVWSADGNLLARGNGSAAVGLFLCTKGGKARLDVEPLTRPGPFALEMRTEREPPDIFLDHPLAASRLISHMVERGVVRTGAQVGKAVRFDLGPERLESMDLLVPIGRCMDVTLALGSDASGAEIRLIDTASGSELAFARGNHATSARACALDTARGGSLYLRAELRVVSGKTAALVATRMLNPVE
jgi:hypothetical protein